ncbi:MAG: DUF2207 domain-containing protein, partial [Microbacteriaceae bacterium]|nr:DUF2207 domain-containing protein [Microbacteriaceae bacterium]
MISRVMKLVAIGFIGLLFLTGCSSGPETIEGFDIQYKIDANGTVHVTETIKYDFGGSEDRHGIDRFLASRFQTDQPDLDRVYKIENVKTSSPTGASALNTQTLGNALQIRIGNKNANVSGTQTYVIKYDILGAINSYTKDDGTKVDEFYWNATGSYWDPFIENTKVTVTGPSAVSAAVCYAGFDGTMDPCDSSATSGNTAEFKQDTLLTRQGLTVRVSWNAGTFSNVAPILEPSLPYDYVPIVTGSNDGPNPFFSPWNWGTGLVLLFGPPLGLLGYAKFARRDQKFAGVTPGEIPTDTKTAQIVDVNESEPVVVRFQPPDDLPVGAATTILKKKRTNSDTVATLVDLAVRGYLRIDEIEGGNKNKAKDYRLVRTPERFEKKQAGAANRGITLKPLMAHEQLMMSKLFSYGDNDIKLSELTNTFASDMKAIQKALDTWMEHQGYFRDKLKSANTVVTWGFMLGVFGFVLASSLALPILIPIIGLDVGLVATAMQAHKLIRRSALGHAVFLQLEGFKLYISTAEADQIRFEEAEDIFARYLPWAMVFGEADRWS